MFGTVLTLFMTLVLAYVVQRSASVPCLAARISSRWFWVGTAGLWGVMAAGRFLGHDARWPGAGWAELAGMTLMGVLFLCFLPLLLVDIASGCGAWGRSWAPRARGWALLAGLALSGAAMVQGLRAPEVVDYEVALPGLPARLDGLTLAALSDLHLGTSIGPRWLEARVAQVQALRPDMILLLGDVFEGHGLPEPRLVQELGRLRAPLGVWGVEGNHERFGGAARPLDGSGIRLLRDEVAVPVPGLVLAGRRDPGRRITGDAAVWEPPAVRPAGALVLLSHIPNQAREAAAAGAGLMLSGHTHGGQIWPLSYLVGLAYPVVAGEVRIGGMTLLVTRGAGTWGPRMRLWRRGEICRIRLKAR